MIKSYPKCYTFLHWENFGSELTHRGKAVDETPGHRLEDLCAFLFDEEAHEVWRDVRFKPQRMRQPAPLGFDDPVQQIDHIGHKTIGRTEEGHQRYVRHRRVGAVAATQRLRFAPKILQMFLKTMLINYSPDKLNQSLLPKALTWWKIWLNI